MASSSADAPASSGTSSFFTSRLGLLLSVLGIAVGTGNIWRFPRIVAQNGGEHGAGAFLVAWIVFLLVWSVPLIVAEYAMGKASRLGVVGAFGKIAGRKYGWMGGFVAVVATAIMFYYSVVTGWCFYYFGQTLAHPLPASLDAARATWDGFQGSAWPLAMHALAMGLGALVILRGVSAIEKMSKILIPTLFVIVVAAVVRAVTLPGAGAGLAYLFTPDWGTLARPDVWLQALTQNAWDTGAGWGLILTYAAYMRKEDPVVSSGLATGIGNNLVSILAATMIFSSVFAILGAEGMARPEILSVMKDSGPASTGLTFMWTPQLFAKMAGGKLLGILFFLGLSFAAFTSLVSMIELAVRVLVDGGMARRKAVLFVASAGFVLGVPSALNLNVLENQDFVWGVALMISGGFIAYAVLRYGLDRFRTQFVETPGDVTAGAWWSFLIRYAVPLQALVLLVWWGWQATTPGFLGEGGLWYDPFNPYSLMTCLVQWGIVAAILFAANGWMMRKTLDAATSSATEDDPFPAALP
ncbi:MAG: sodium-dependent transporter [Bacteroidetes bacterium]|nr:sodium-dependent transporter [Bacteroidota bacterium]